MDQTHSFDLKKYLFVLKKRWRLSVTIFLAVVAMGITYCLFWPKVYEASALVVVQPQKIPGAIVKPTVTTKINERLQIITQQVLSRTRLTEIIERFGLYSGIRGTVAPDDLAETMRNDIKIKLTRKNYFTITYHYSDPQATAKVTNALASFYVDSNLRIREQDALGTTRFLNRELDRLRSQLQEWERRITGFKQAHLHELPGTEEANLQLANTHSNKAEHFQHQVQVERQRIDREEVHLAMITAEIEKMKIRRAHQRRSGAGGSGGTSDSETEPSAIKAELERLIVLYTEDHPDVQRLKRHLVKALQKKAEKEKYRQIRLAKLKKKGVKVEAAPENDVQELDIEMGNLRSQRSRTAQRIAEAKRRVDIYRKLRDREQQFYNDVKNRVERTPGVEEKLDELTRGYDILKKAHATVYAKWQDANIASNLERTQRGEQFQVVDPAQTPTGPFRPDVKKALPLTLFAALALAVGLSFGLNFIDTSFTSVVQLERLAELPVLVVVPPLDTPEEKTRSNRRNLIIGLIYGCVFLVLLVFTALLVTDKVDSLTRIIQRIF